MADWASITKDLKWLQIFKALPLDDGPDTTRAVVLTVNASVCLGVTLCFATLCWMGLRRDVNVGAMTVIAGVITAAVTAMLGFAMSMQKARDARPSVAVEATKDSDGATSLKAESQG